MRTSKTVLTRALLLVILYPLSYAATAQLKAGFTSSVPTGCAPLIVSFTNTSSGSPVTYKWDLGNGVTSDEPNPTTSYFDAGVYTVRLVIYNGPDADSVVKTSYITVYQNPVAAFSVSDSTGCFPLHVVYTDKSQPGSGSIASQTWDFGDGNISTQLLPSHSYLAEGNFSVTLTVANSYGCKATLAKQNLITVGKGVHAAYTVTAGAICHSPAAYNFSSTSTGDGTLSYKWGFGDGGFSAQQQPSHNYTREGAYNVSLKVTSSKGCSDSVTKPLSVAFVKSAISVPDTVCVNSQLQFNNLSVPTPSSAIWSFGDNTSSSQLSPVKTYALTGAYTIKLVNTFSAGCVDSAIKKINVVNGVKPSFTTQDTAGCVLPFKAQFKNTTAGNANYAWNFGDGTTSTLANPVHEYNRYGSFTVTLTVTNGGGCAQQAIITNAVTIQPFKIINVSGILPGCVPFTLKPAVQTSGNTPIKTYTWDFGDGTILHTANPVHIFTKEGIYTIKVKVETQDGCTDSLTIIDSVGRKLHPTFTISPANACASQAVTVTNTTTEPGSFLWWNMGDGYIIYKQPAPWHNYKDTGYFSPMLIVMENGCYDTLIKPNGVHITGPIARFKAAHDCNSRTTINLSNQSIDDKSRKWDFGDGTFETAKNPSHVYSAPGTYHVTLTVDNGACTYITDTTIKVVNERGVLNIADTVSCHNTKLNYKVGRVNEQNIAGTAWNFTGNNMINVAGIAASYNYPANGKFTPYVVVTDILGCTDTLKSAHSVSVYGPTAVFKALEAGACKNSTINFADTSITDGVHPLMQWAVDYGNGNKVNYTSKARFKNTYTDTGLYTITMGVTDSYGCYDATTLVNAVHITRPYAALQVVDTVICPGSQSNIRDKSIGAGLQITWAFGDGTISNKMAAGSTVSHNYPAKEGMYYPTVYATDINNCIDSASFAVGVRVFNPSAKFLLSDSFSACPPLTVGFNNQSQNFAAYQWSFGDGNTSALIEPAHIYTYPGTYTAKLVLSGKGGCIDSLVKNITIKGPTGTLQYNKAPACYPYTQQFKAASQNAVQYLWDYADGKTKLTANDTSSHVYTPGNYAPKIILIDREGCKVPVKGLDTLAVYTVRSKPFASNQLVCDSGKIVLTDSSFSNDVIVSRRWVINNAAYVSGAQVTQYFNTPGLFNIMLVDVTANGCTDSAKLEKPVKVVQSPLVNISGAMSYCVPAVVSLQSENARHDTSAISWNWDFGNGATSNVQNPAGIPFNNAGNYTAKLLATNSSGCAATAQATLAVHALPQVNAGADTTICLAGSLALHATGASTYNWQAAPGISCLSCSNPIAKPDSSITYSVTGKDAFGCAGTDSILVTVNQPVHISASRADTLCNGQSRQLVASGAHTYQWYPSLYLSDAASGQPTFQAVRDTAIAYKVIGYDSKKCFADTATVKVKVYPIPQMQVMQTAVTASVGSQFTLSTVSSPDVTKWKWSPALWLDNPAKASPVAQPRESITYTVVAANDGACITRAQVTVTVICSGANIFVPNTFSPNGDGVNDRFYAQGKGLYNIKSFKIFNRLGQIVFDRVNIGANSPADGWDGTFNGQKLSPDVYVYIIEVLCNNSIVVPVKGNITLLR